MFSQLADLANGKKIDFKATGEGISTLAATGGTNDRFALNRRIKIIFPPPTAFSQPAAGVSASATR
jgi:hypothetical protein